MIHRKSLIAMNALIIPKPNIFVFSNPPLSRNIKESKLLEFKSVDPRSSSTIFSPFQYLSPQKSNTRTPSKLNMVSSGTPLIGSPGTLIHRSPDGRLSLHRGMISSFPAEAIVSATNKHMNINTANIRSAEHQIVNTAGAELRNHLYYNYPLGLPVGSVLATSSFGATNCWYLIHVHGPDFGKRGRYVLPLLKQQLADCYRRCMEEAFRLGVKSIAFPCIGSGLMGWPRDEAARIGVATVRAWLRHAIHGKARRKEIERVAFLVDPVGKHADQEQAWCSAFR
jgi:O-acetyl-ADP-ribose deacetylase